MREVQIINRVSGSGTFDQSVTVPYDNDDSVSDIIGRVCLVLFLDFDPRMFLVTDTGVETAGEDQAHEYFRHGMHLNLRSRTVTKQRWAGVIVALIVGILSVILTITLFSVKHTPKIVEAVVIDAGSSHTSALLYHWSSDLISGTGLVQEMEEIYLDTPVTSFAGDPGNLTTFMQDLINDMKDWDSTSSDIPIYVGATAGMRILQESEPEQVDEILEVIERVIKNSRFEVGDVEILSGSDESLFSWLSVNVLSGTILGSPKGLSGNEQIETAGALDMGGGSLEVAFNCVDGCDQTEALGAFNQNFTIWSSKSSCYGLKEAMGRFMASAIFQAFQGTDNLTDSLIPNPCVNKHFNQLKDTWLSDFPTEKSDIFANNCTHILDPEFLNWLDSMPDDFEFHFDDSYDEMKCDQILEPFTNFTTCQEIFGQDCLNPMEFLMPNDIFYGISSFYYNFRSPLNLEESSDYDTVMNKIKAVCQDPQSCDTCSKTDCFEVSYIFKVLTDGLSFNEDNFGNLKFVDQIEGSQVSWTLGYATVRSQEIGVPQGEGLISTSIFAIWLGFGVALTLLGCLGLYVFQRKMRNLTLNKTAKEGILN
ncbi:hypothetical protein TCAL_05182 [Tigriopus californicus]|uniref:Uncharacterized protein n=1 Tax=Tigriopus californicus TaxID=6832 RepID=A0A553NQ85_TIGCA|nr:ectonucleoside triphosphate diphosphohydrolase 1-like [Tigriopus californicus]TRY67603.1 hypothetical protein TCAL_05182 [Tigriopus californicus]|eukprot:TCALIF_05182-PA protein Name:"Similar to ENTPD1 Ectonucleoside triphosphate diphosphohydrolase 1 (Homo sapiens)" AED:0.01 eAED:0.01 QI:192/1/0.5/1/1/0.5/2/0/591